MISLLQELEDMLPVRESYAETRDLPAVADRVAETLAAVPTWRARSAVVDYAEATHMESQRAVAALSGLGRQDLSSDDLTVDRLIRLMASDRFSDPGKSSTPRSDHDHEHMVPVIEALSGTPLPVVKHTLRQILQRYPGKSSGRAAARALDEFSRRKHIVSA